LNKDNKNNSNYNLPHFGGELGRTSSNHSTLKQSGSHMSHNDYHQSKSPSKSSHKYEKRDLNLPDK